MEGNSVDIFASSLSARQLFAATIFYFFEGFQPAREAGRRPLLHDRRVRHCGPRNEPKRPDHMRQDLGPRFPSLERVEAIGD